MKTLEEDYRDALHRIHQLAEQRSTSPWDGERGKRPDAELLEDIWRVAQSALTGGQ